MSITLATESDILDLVDLVNICYRGEESFKGWTTEADLLDGTRTNPQQLKKDFQNPNITILKYTSDQGELVGCISGTSEGDGKMGTGMFAVRPEMQAQGIGRKLMRAVEELARNNNCAAMKMDVVSSRDELIAWYMRQGFRKVGVPLHFREVAPTIDFGTPKNNLEFIVLQKQL